MPLCQQGQVICIEYLACARFKVKLFTCHGGFNHHDNISRKFQKNIYYCFIDYAKAFVWITKKCGKFFKRWWYQTTWPASWEICMQVRKQQLEPDMEQQTGSKLGKEFIKAVYCHPTYLTYMQNTSCKMLGWRKHKLESRLLGEVSITSDMQMTPLLWQKAKKNKRTSWWKWKRRVKKLA